jgi:hypothetical protein
MSKKIKIKLINKKLHLQDFWGVNYVINKSQNATTQPCLNTKHLLVIKIMLPKIINVISIFRITYTSSL